MGPVKSARDPLNSAYYLLKAEMHASKKEEERKTQTHT